MLHKELVLILDFGAQYTQLIARRVRELNVYCEIHPFNLTEKQLHSLKPSAIILSGGPSSVYADSAPLPDASVFKFAGPILGICYGMQLLGRHFDGKVIRADKRTYGRAELNISRHDDLFRGLDPRVPVWESHGDHLDSAPADFEVLASTENTPVAAIRHRQRRIFGVQFHPEVVHTPDGSRILKNFLFDICKLEGDWTPTSFIHARTDDIRSEVGAGKVLCAVSGGVDSTVVAFLLNHAIPDQLTCVFVDTGLLRKNEAREVESMFKRHLGSHFVAVDAADLFLNELKGVVDPEEKRKIIGRLFIEVFEREAHKLKGRLGSIDFLAQGTLYPDVIESVSFKGPSATIKSHHNVGGLPEKMNLKLIEPLRELFKDEVRSIGRDLGIDEALLMRHPFPGPGLAVRLPGEITGEKLNILREADAIYIEELLASGYYAKVWQAFAVLLPVKSVGVMGDHRTYQNTISLRAVTSLDGMTADWAQLPYELLARVSNRIINEIDGVNRVVYDISSKPPSTIEWE